MLKKNFHSEKMLAVTMLGVETDPNKLNYWNGYLRGLRRAQFGDLFGTEAEHKLWLSLENDSDLSRRARGRGYQDGLSRRE